MSWAPHLPLAHLPAALSPGFVKAPKEDTQDLWLGWGCGLALLLPLGNFKSYPTTPFFGMRAPLFPSLAPRPMYAAVGFFPLPFFLLSPLPFPKSWEPPWPVQSLAAVRAPGTRNGTRGSRTQDPGPWAGPQEGHGGHRGPAAHPFLSSLPLLPCLFPAPSILTAPADPAAVGSEHI